MDTLISFGGAAKALGNGKVGGYLVTFGDSDNTDLEHEFYAKSTDFDLERSDATTVYYNHALDVTIKGRKLGAGTLKTDDVGVWIDAQLNLADEYEKAIYGMVKRGKLGWSSGTAPHLVTRTKVGNAFRIDAWALGLDASLTPTPCEPRNSAISLKSWQESAEVKALSDPMANIDLSMTSAALDRLVSAMWDCQYQCVYQDKEPIANRVALWEACCRTLSDKGGEMILDLEEMPDEALKTLLGEIDARRGRKADRREPPTNIREAEEALRDAGFTVKQAKSVLSGGWKSISRDVEAADTKQPDSDWRQMLVNLEMTNLEEMLR